MKHFNVDAKDYALFEYEAYFDKHFNPTTKPKKLTYNLGDVVYIKTENAIGVVLGCINEVRGELRTDMSGIVDFSGIELATSEHFLKADVKIVDKLKNELCLVNTGTFIH